MPEVSGFLTTIRCKTISIMIGLEGGFTEDEVNLAKKSGFQTVHLGPRIFRTETASLIILSIIQFILGDLKLSPEIVRFCQISEWYNTNPYLPLIEIK